MALIVTASLALAAAFLTHHQIYSSISNTADSSAYQFYAVRFREHGPFYDFGTIRTYGYPLFLYLLTFVSGYDHGALALVSGIAQYAIFLAAVLWLACLVSAFSFRLALAVLAGLLLNPLVISLITDALTEGLSLSLYVFLAALAVRICTAETSTTTVASLISAGFVAAMMLMVRPANVSVVVAWYLSVAIAVMAWKGSRGDWHRHALAVAGAFIAAGVLVWGPQLVYNLSLYGTATIFPVCRLGDLQAAYGVFLWKYDTLVTGDIAGPWYYINPLFQGQLPVGGGGAVVSRAPTRRFRDSPGTRLQRIQRHEPVYVCPRFKPPIRCRPARALLGHQSGRPDRSVNLRTIVVS
ncbi:hypothetical protein [Bosea sp. NBC_00550]|uniref:hypothetical protein n=1 Tax=Bosea sp. NBC_00550 TaxID=2969621 RepID=UPI00222FEF57|nr:hypothetical protein [Bosea sp. NBC_00550]UZF94456.1 hypothetical protein NWE53_09895 [Bosea sp. NBC_00550]